MKSYLLLYLLLVGTMVAGLVKSSVKEIDFSVQGPIKFTTQTIEISLAPQDLIKTYGKTLTLYVRIPTTSSSRPPPLLWWFSGFQQSSSAYTQLQDRAASWGWAVISYNNPRSKSVAAKTELELISYIQTHCLRPSSQQLKQSSICSPLHNINFSTQVTAGHSRGGKIAALAYASSQLDISIAATFLIDPVDTTNYIPDSDKNPSAVAALSKRGGDLPVGILGAGILSSCNPKVKGGKTQCEALEAVAGRGSWSATAPTTSHSQFADGGWFINKVQDLLCGKGKINREEVAEIESVCMLNWWWKMGVAPELDDAGSSPEKAFGRWLRMKVEGGQLADVRIKGEDGIWVKSRSSRDKMRVII